MQIYATNNRQTGIKKRRKSLSYKGFRRSEYALSRKTWKLPYEVPPLGPSFFEIFRERTKKNNPVRDSAAEPQTALSARSLFSSAYQSSYRHRQAHRNSQSGVLPLPKIRGTALPGKSIFRQPFFRENPRNLGTMLSKRKVFR